MSWTFKDAVFHGDLQNIKTGDKVVVTLENLDDPDNPQSECLTWGYAISDIYTPTQFRDMVRGEVKACLAQLNRVKPSIDVSSIYTP